MDPKQESDVLSLGGLAVCLATSVGFFVWQVATYLG
jgi:hypothetical protein